MRKVFSYVGRYKLRMAFGLLIKVIGTIMDLAIPYVLSFIIDDLIPTKDIKKICLFGVLMIVFSIIGVTFNVIANRMASWVARNVTTDLRHDLFVKTQKLSSSQIDEITMPSLISRMSTDTYNVHQMVGMMQRMGVRAPILLIGGIVVAFTLDRKMTLVLICVLPLIAIATTIVSKIGIPIYKKVQIAVDGMVRTVRENASGIRVIKALSKGEYETKRFAKVNQEVMNYELKSGKTMATLNPIINVLLNFGLVIVIIVGATRVNSGLTGVGKIISFTSYFTIILNAMLSVTRLFIIYSRSSASASRIEEVFNLPYDLQVELSEINKNYQACNHIEFKHVNFSYNKKENNLDSVSFTLKKGESLGIIGATGSGKSTIIQLLMRFYDVTSGEVMINGYNVKNYSATDLKKMFGVVLQNDNIFSNTIRENITFGREYKEEDLQKALKVSQALTFINENEEGLDYWLAPKGTNISGGQRQRLFIARALVCNPEILILDDASSALDYKTDSLLRQGIKENYDEITTIIVTQRISSIINCDKILVIDEGKILGQGTHKELLASVSIYQEIFASQMGGEDNE